ncbi:MAG: DUF2177 family protein [bacterium]
MILYYARLFLLTFIVFFSIDILWLGFIARRLYLYFLGPLLRDPVNWTAAILFYILFIIGLIIFAIEPALKQHSVTNAFIKGALFGFFTYMTYDLTNLAVLKDWPVGVVLIDILWGTILCSLVSGVSVYIYLAISS